MEDTKKKILFVTGTRADYGKLKPLMQAVEQSEDFELHIFVTGMHLLEIFGDTYGEVLKDGYEHVYVAEDMTCDNQASVNMGNNIARMAEHVEKIKPDMIVVHGDRPEALAGAIVGALHNILVAHIEGGEVSGTIDESIRHAVSKFAHLHFVSNEEAKKRIVQLGEDKNAIFPIGSPDIDIMLSDTLPSLEEVHDHYDIGFKDYAVFMHHPVTTEYSKMEDHIKTVVDALLASEKNYVVIYPNNDLGSEIILQEFERLRDKENIALYPSLRFEYFLTLLKHANFIIGNSSAGVRESGVYGVPAINIGTRQNGRFFLEQTQNIQQVSEHVEDILKAIASVDAYRKEHFVFGKGDSTEKFMDVLRQDDIWNKALQKKFVDMSEN